MSVANVKASSTTWISQTAPGTSYMASGALRVSASSSAGAKSFLYFTVPVPPGAVVSAAQLTVYLVGPSTGWGTINLYRCTNRIADSAKSWTNQPSIGGIQGSATPGSGSLADATPVTFDVTAIVNQWAIGGLPNYGLEVQQTGTTLLMFYSAHSAHPPTLQITYTTPPDTPHNLMPNGTISVTKPVVQFGPYGDADGDALAALQVQVAPPGTTFSAATGFSTPTFDSGAVTAVVPELDLSTTSFSGFGSTPQSWTVRVKDSSGAWSAWADPASCTVTAKPTVTMSSPSPSSPVVTEVTPQIVWTAPGMTSYQVQILDAATGAILADSKHVAGTVGQWGVP